jgi:site-specific DNA-methyltransferase (adenine-specific)
MTKTKIMKGDALASLKQVPDNSIDSIVTDPPYEIGLLGKSWDSSGIAFSVELWKECLRVLKPGGYLLTFGSTRTSHRMVVAIEDAGFEIRDTISWVYGSGMPKSHNVSIAIDKQYGLTGHRGKRASFVGNRSQGQNVEPAKAMPAYVPVSDEAKRWFGYGSALKPSVEPICVARKPLDGTIAANIIKYGVGAFNIEVSRVDDESSTLRRWPANLVHDGSDEVIAGFPQSNGGAYPKNANVSPAALLNGGWKPLDNDARTETGSGSASRFFYCAKPSKRERDAGLTRCACAQATPAVSSEEGTGVCDECGGINVRHPTQKPTTLLRYLVNLCTPAGGTCLDPFMGSGSLAVACVLDNFQWLGCELTPAFWPIIEQRVKEAEREVARRAKQGAAA